MRTVRKVCLRRQMEGGGRAGVLTSGTVCPPCALSFLRTWSDQRPPRMLPEMQPVDASEVRRRYSGYPLRTDAI